MFIACKSTKLKIFVYLSLFFNEGIYKEEQVKCSVKEI